MNHLPKALQPKAGLRGWSRVWYFSWLSTLSAALYFLSGKLGLALAIPPGYATAIWPPSGFAVVLLLTYGRHAGIGVLLGSFLLNLTITFKSGTDVTFAAFVACFVIGIGALLQAALAVTLVRRAIPTFPRLAGEIDIPKFLVLAGPLSCVVNATVSVSALCLIGAIPVSSFAVSWMTWYFGDTIGVVFVAPLLLIMMTDGIAASFKEKTLIVVPIVLSFCLTVGIYMSFSAREEKRQRDEVAAVAGEFTDSIRKQFDRVSVIQKAIEGFFVASSNVKPDEFKSFSSLLLRSVPELRALSWNPLVSAAELAALEETARLDGLTTFTVFGRETAKSGPDTERFHVPILYIEPLDQNRLAQGFDIASDPVRREAIDMAVRKQEPVATAPVRLVQGARGFGFLALHPVIKDQSVTGFAVAVMAYDDLLGAATAAMPGGLGRLGLRAVDTGSGITVYQTGDWGVAKNSHVEHREVDIANRKLLISLHDLPAMQLGERGYASFLVLVFGMLFSTLISAFILTFAVRRRILERNIEIATLQVKVERQKLEEAARLSSLGEMAGGIAHEINNPLTIIDGHSRKIKRSLEKLGIQDQSISHSVDYIHKTVDRISQIIVGLRKVARDGSKDELRDSVLKEIITETISLCSEKFRMRGVRLVVQEIPDTVVSCRPVQISQVLLNLLTNSFHASSRTQDSWIKVAAWESGQFVLIAVTDSGQGIPEDFRGRMFEPFFTTKEVGQGTGLGLSTSRSIVESHGGELVYDTDLGHTRFTVRLPKRPAVTGQTARSA